MATSKGSIPKLGVFPFFVAVPVFFFWRGAAALRGRGGGHRSEADGRQAPSQRELEGGDGERKRPPAPHSATGSRRRLRTPRHPAHMPRAATLMPPAPPPFPPPRAPSPRPVLLRPAPLGGGCSCARGGARALVAAGGGAGGISPRSMLMWAGWRGALRHRLLPSAAWGAGGLILSYPRLLSPLQHPLALRLPPIRLYAPPATTAPLRSRPPPKNCTPSLQT